MTKALVAVLLLGALGLAPGTAHAEPREGALYIALGDSLAVGVGSSAPEQLSYPSQLFHRLRGWSRGQVREMINLGRGGETSGSVVSGGRLAEALALIADPSTEVDVVTIGIGGDDLLPLLQDPACAANPAGVACQSLVATALFGFAEDFPTVVATLSAALAADPGDGVLLVMTYYNPFSGTGSVFETPVDLALLGADLTVDCTAAAANPANAGLNDLITCITAVAGGTVVDVYGEFEGAGVRLTHIAESDVHASNHGYRAIVEAFLAALPE